MKLLFDFGCIFCVTFSLTFELLSSTRTWYASDERKIYEWSIVPTRQRTIFDIRTSISGKNGNICCLAVNYQIGNQVFVSDTGENKILRLDIESDWALDQPIKVQKEIVRDRVAHSLVYDDTNDFLYFATIDFIWRARKDGTSLISLRKIMPHFKVLSMEFNVKKSELLWSSWNEHDKTGKLTTSHVPELTCTKDIFEGNSKLESMFLFSPDKLYAVDSINMKIVSFDVNTTQLVASKRSREEFSEVHGGDAAKGLFVHSESKMIYLNEKSRELVFCAHSGCSFLNFFSTEFTPSDIKLNLSRQIAADAIKYQPKLISAHQTYYFPDSVVFDFDTDANQVSKDYPPRFAKFQYQASIQLLQEIAPTEKAVSKLVLAGTKNEFRNLVGSSSFQLNISYREAECPNSHFRLLGSLNVCTEPAEAYDFAFDGEYIFWKHSREIIPSDWIVALYRAGQSSQPGSIQQAYPINLAVKGDHVIYRLDTLGRMKYNDSLKLIAQFECEGNILTSRATEFEIRQIVDVDDTAFEKATTSTDSGAEMLVQDEDLTSYKLLFVSLVILLLGMIFLLFSYYRKKKTKRKFNKTAIDQVKVAENVVRYSTLRRSVNSYATISTSRPLLHNQRDSYLIGSTEDSIYMEIGTQFFTEQTEPEVESQNSVRMETKEPDAQIRESVESRQAEPNYYSFIEDEIEAEHEMPELNDNNQSKNNYFVQYPPMKTFNSPETHIYSYPRKNSSF